MRNDFVRSTPIPRRAGQFEKSTVVSLISRDNRIMQWPMFARFVEDPRLAIDTNAVANAIRLFTLSGNRRIL
jgi:hypothetical protein